MRKPGIERWTGLVMVGDRLAGLLWPREYLRKLQVGPQALNAVLEACAQRPVLTRVLCTMEVTLGAWIFTRGSRDAKAPALLRNGSLLL
jgi:hypothetical protein